MTDAPIFAPPIQRMVEGFAASLARPFDPANLAAVRERFSARSGPAEIAAGVTVTDLEAGGVPVRLYRPKRAGALPLHVHFHGGGFVLGSAHSGQFDGALSRRAARSGAIVASVEYRLAPEHRFPAGVEDSYAALAGLVGQAEELGVAAEAVSVGGVSSGGNFAAAVALMARDRGGPRLVLQLLEIAGTDLTKSSFAWRNFAPGHDTTRERDLAMVDLYLPDVASRAHPYASPLFAPDLSGLPAAYVMNAEFDPRRDECEAYVARLRDAGVEAIARTMAGHVHGSMSLRGWPPAERWETEAAAVLADVNRRALSGQPVVLPGDDDAIAAG
jgi:acetyl esterase